MTRWLIGAIVFGLLLGGSYKWAYERGERAANERWQIRYNEAEDLVLKAELRTAQAEQEAADMTAKLGAKYGEAFTTITTRLDAAEQSNRKLLRDIAALVSRSDQLPEDSGGTAGGTAAAEVDERVQRLGERVDRVASNITRIGHGCELDAAALNFWINWYPEQRRIRTQ